MLTPILEFKNVSKKFNNNLILKKVSFQINQGEIVGIIGRSGSGKTTIFRLILGYYEPTNGIILYKDKPTNIFINELRSAVGYATQENSFYLKLTVLENMRYYAPIYKLSLKGKNLDAHIFSILKKLNLHKHSNTRAENLSGGMKRRLDFAISLLHNPDILVLDEPTTGLDPALVKDFWRIINQLKKEGKTIFFTSHILEEIEKNCDQVIILDSGKIKKILDKSKILEGVYKYLY